MVGRDVGRVLRVLLPARGLLVRRRYVRGWGSAPVFHGCAPNDHTFDDTLPDGTPVCRVCGALDLSSLLFL